MPPLTRMLPARALVLGLILVTVIALPLALLIFRGSPTRAAGAAARRTGYEPRKKLDTSGLWLAVSTLPDWGANASLEEIASRWQRFGYKGAERAEKALADPNLSPTDRVRHRVLQALCLNYEGEPEKAYAALEDARTAIERDDNLAREQLYTLIYYQGLTGLRLGETENCVRCRGISACILPFDTAAVHQKPHGSQLAVRHFTEYLQQFPDDTQVRWLLNLAHMTLGEYPARVDPRYVISLDVFQHSEFDIGKFRDVAFDVGLEHENEAGGAVMDDFDGDGFLDIVTTSFDPGQSMAFFRNTGHGRFQDATKAAGLTAQLGGLNCVQADYDNDGDLDIFVMRGAWVSYPIRPSLLRNDGRAHFTDVTREAGLLTSVNSNAACWADYDNDGHLDLFVCCERQPNRLYHNQGDGRFVEVAHKAGLFGTEEKFCKGAVWLDYDGDDYPDLFMSFLDGDSHLFHNERNGMFADVTLTKGIQGPHMGFACWPFDYDNDGWQDIFATSYERNVDDILHGMAAEKHKLPGSKLYHNEDGKVFEDMSEDSGVDQVFATMGSNFGDFDNDGYLDMYLGTGDPGLDLLVPNRMLRNVDGGRFAEITGTSGTGHLQKGHGVACGDWDRDGNVDLFVETGGAVPGDRYHNLLFQNPGHQNRWITVKLVGTRTNRSAIGARIKVKTAGKSPQVIYRWITPGSSFGANPLEQTIGLGAADKVATLEVHWPTSRTTQTFKDLSVNQRLTITEFSQSVRNGVGTAQP